MTLYQIRELCDLADSIDPETYGQLCEEPISDEKFVEGLRKIINSGE